MKLSGVEFKRYYTDPEFWPDGLWHEDEIALVDGVPVAEGDIDLGEVADDCVVDIKAGAMLMPLGKQCRFSEMSMEAHMRAWHKKQTTRNLLVQVDESKLEAVIAAIKAAGGRVTA